jgi:RNA recognition motif-containing protein
LSTSLYVANLPLSTDESILTGAFAVFGKVLSVKLKRDPIPGFTRCYGFVEMSTIAEARNAAAALNATRFEGRLLSVWRAARS